MADPRVLVARAPSAIEINKVLRSTYALLAMTLVWSAVTASAAVALGAPHLGFITLLVFIGLLFMVHKTANSAWGLVWTFALTGFLGFSLAPLLSAVLGMANGGMIVAQSLGITAVAFFGLSIYTVTTKRDFSFLTGFLIVGAIVILASWVVSLFYWTTLMSQVMAGICILFGAALILWETSAVVRGEETNYIRATVGIYVGLYNIFSSVLLLFGLGGDD
ncbi:MAG: Bax inhibitor-1 family protein [Gammaproteobacteria bacterium]|nr:Bax inhibitor-1 family protein [Gammaproteobacteria bacterium]